LGANTQLSPAIALQWAGEVTIGFHARHKAIRRIYRYCILNRSARSALQRARAAWIHRPLDAAAMHAAAQVLIGEHDFSAFRSVECQSKTAVRRVERVEVRREGDYLWLEIAANAYLHHMVRNIVGTLLDVQRETDPAAAMAEVLAGGKRRFAGATAPASGLYLWRVEYPPVYGIPALGPGLLLPPAD
jgi:tRNA pseudouridine38-40 synthase